MRSILRVTILNAVNGLVALQEDVVIFRFAMVGKWATLSCMKKKHCVRVMRRLKEKD